MIIYQYRIKAIGFGAGLSRNPLNFTVTSNYDIETHHEEVMNKIRNELKKVWGTGYEILSVKREEKNWL